MLRMMESESFNKFKEDVLMPAVAIVLMLACYAHVFM